MADRDPVPLPAEVRARLAELELELSEGDITQKGYEKKRSKLIGAFFPQTPGMEPQGQERRGPVTPSSSSRYHRRRSSGSRDERYRSDVHTEAVQAALAKHKERKLAVPMPSKRRSLVVQTSMDAYTPPDTSSGSEGEGQGDEEEGGDGEEDEKDGGGGGGGVGGTTTSSRDGSISMERWINRTIHGTSSTNTSSTASSSSSSTRSGGSGAAGGRLADVLAQHVHISAHQHHVRHHHHHHHHRHKTENHSAPPDVTGYTNNSSSDGIQVERAPGQRQTPKYGNAELMETGDGVPVSSRVSAKIQQLVNTLKRPKRPPLREFFVDDFEELLEVQQPDPNQPKAEGAQMEALQGEQLGVVTNWPPSLEAALQRWGTISPKAPCLTTMDTNGKPLYLLTYDTLPKTPLGGIHLSETKQLFLEGALHPCNVLMCPHTCVTNLPKPRQKQPEIGPASVMVGNLVSGKRIAQASGRDLVQIEDNDQARKFLFLSEVLQWRAQTTPDHVLYTLLNCRGTIASSLTCVQLHKRAEKIAGMLAERGHLQDGDHVALVYPPGIDLIVAFYGCLYAGCVPITVRPPHPQNISTTLPTVKMIVEVSRSVCVMTTQLVSKLLRSKEASAAVEIRSWPPIMDTDDLPKKKPPLLHKPSNPDILAYLDFSVSTTGMLAGVKMSHTATSAFCRSIKLQCELYPSREVAICLDPYCGLGFVLWCLCSVYSGHQSILIPPSELELNPSLWLSAVSQFKVRDTFCSYSVMELCTKGLGLQTDSLKARGLDLSRVRTCVVVAEERPRTALTQSFSKLFKDLGLHPRAVSTSFGCRVNLAICLQPHRLGKFSDQGTSGPDPTTVFVDMRALRHDRVRLVERGSPHSLPLMESGKILPGVRIIIANPETKGPMGESHLGEIWVQSGHNSSGYFTVYGDEALQSDHFNSRLSFGDTQTLWARTGYLGFLRRTELTDASGERHDALYVVGALEEAMELRGMRYHPIDIETSVIRTHKSITECAVFTWTNLLVVVVELDGSEHEALDLVPLVTNVVLEEHYLIVGVVVVVDIGVIPINSRGEKQRMHLRDGFLADQLDPIYVAYNM
ncbi:disco-interacting protein 2 homolog C-like [Pseudochaenichthys georgianus]|uniref:disco-interacting protein 2 homolog C-like n=1 Tax=Pseudochaenichthys georgianus TaxID=52239 RepID=UPI001469A570|nr:disco-interacting protein 2 homolog C-like [Pseudochaenichthys georgianus]